MTERSPIEKATLDTAALREFGARHGNQGRDETSKIIGQAADEIDRLRALVEKLQEPPPCQHTMRQGWTKGDVSETWCTQCGKKMEPQIFLWDGVKPVFGGEK